MRFLIASASIAVALAASGLPACAEISASASMPIRADIDASCRAGAQAAGANAPSRGHIVWLFRNGTSRPGTTPLYGPWQTPPGTLHAPASSVVAVVEEVHAVLERGELVFATDTLSDSFGEGGIVRDYCYRAGKLARATITIPDPSEDLVYSRVVYYDASGAPVADSGQQTKTLDHGARAPQKLPASSLAIAPYLKPEQLPFYGALHMR